MSVCKKSKVHQLRCTFCCSVYSRVLVLLSFAQMTPVRCSVSVEFTHHTPDGWSRRISIELVRAGAACMRGREEKGKAAETETGVWLTLLPIRRWPLWSEPFPWETSLSPLHVQTGCHFYFAELLFSCTDAGLWSTRFLTLTRKGFVSLPDVDKIWQIFMVVMLFWLKLYLHLVLFCEMNAADCLIKMAKFEIGLH